MDDLSRAINHALNSSLVQRDASVAVITTPAFIGVALQALKGEKLSNCFTFFVQQEVLSLACAGETLAVVLGFRGTRAKTGAVPKAPEQAGRHLAKNWPGFDFTKEDSALGVLPSRTFPAPSPPALGWSQSGRDDLGKICMDDHGQVSATQSSIQMYRFFIRKYSAPDRWVLVLHSGVGSMLLAAALEHRSAAGIVSQECKYATASKRISEFAEHERLRIAAYDDAQKRKEGGSPTQPDNQVEGAKAYLAAMAAGVAVDNRPIVQLDVETVYKRLKEKMDSEMWDLKTTSTCQMPGYDNLSVIDYLVAQVCSRVLYDTST